MDKMETYRAHLCLQEASNFALLSHWAEENSKEFHRKQCVEQLERAAAHLGIELTEPLSPNIPTEAHEAVPDGARDA